MTLRLQIEPGGEKYFSFAKQKLGQMKAWMKRAGLRTLTKHFDISAAERVTINAIDVGHNVWLDWIKITAGGSGTYFLLVDPTLHTTTQTVVAQYTAQAEYIHAKFQAVADLIDLCRLESSLGTASIIDLDNAAASMVSAIAYLDGLYTVDVSTAAGATEAATLIEDLRTYVVPYWIDATNYIVAAQTDIDTPTFRADYLLNTLLDPNADLVQSYLLTVKTTATTLSSRITAGTTGTVDRATNTVPASSIDFRFSSFGLVLPQDVAGLAPTYHTSMGLNPAFSAVVTDYIYADLAFRPEQAFGVLTRLSAFRYFPSLRSGTALMARVYTEVGPPSIFVTWATEISRNSVVGYTADEPPVQKFFSILDTTSMPSQDGSGVQYFGTRPAVSAAADFGVSGSDTELGPAPFNLVTAKDVRLYKYSVGEFVPTVVINKILPTNILNGFSASSSYNLESLGAIGCDGDDFFLAHSNTRVDFTADGVGHITANSASAEIGVLGVSNELGTAAITVSPYASDTDSEYVSVLGCRVQTIPNMGHKFVVPFAVNRRFSSGNIELWMYSSAGVSALVTEYDATKGFLYQAQHQLGTSISGVPAMAVCAFSESGDPASGVYLNVKIADAATYRLVLSTSGASSTPFVQNSGIAGAWTPDGVYFVVICSAGTRVFKPDGTLFGSSASLVSGAIGITGFQLTGTAGTYNSLTINQAGVRERPFTIDPDTGAIVLGATLDVTTASSAGAYTGGYDDARRSYI